jgi:hypothetical protein
MGFWIFMLITELLMPAIMIVFGRVFMKNPPKSINMVYGYRTKLSMRNQDTWDFAHRYFGKIWYISGLVLLPISVIPMVLVMGKGDGPVGLVGGALTFVQLIVLIGAMIPPEIALSKQFDSDGNPR